MKRIGQGIRSRSAIVARAGVFAFLAAAATPAWSADLRMGYIDSARIFLEYDVAKEAQARFDRQVTGWRDEAAEKQKSVEQLRSEVRDQSPMLSTPKRREKEEELQRAIAEYERFVQDVWGPQGRAVQENERATAEVVTQIRSAVEKVASDAGLDLVLDAASGYIIYANRTLDKTQEVLDELRRRSPAITTPK
jgi:outer membrane protein